MSNPVIQVRNLSKTYRLGVIGRHTLQDEIYYQWLKLRGRDPAEHMSWLDHRQKVQPRQGVFTALNGVSFNVEQGEIVGIIGRNGAGKSTLLKILSRITEPSAGEAIIEGRWGSLLEVGTGFHPDLTGRENIYMNGTILGMRKSEIDSKFDTIATFSEIEPFLDTPVKRYSSGMYVRLAFAVAAHLEPDILILDEVLAVGDASFQQKCHAKISEVANSGRTILFVSHNMAAVRALCSRCLLVENGTIACDGDTLDVVSTYEAANNMRASINRRRLPATSACGDLEITDIALLPQGDDLAVHLEVGAIRRLPRIGVGFEIRHHMGEPLISQGAVHSGACANDLDSNSHLVLNINGVMRSLNGGDYTMRLWLSAPDGHRYVDIPDAGTFTVAGKDPTEGGQALTAAQNGPVFVTASLAVQSAARRQES